MYLRKYLVLFSCDSANDGYAFRFPVNKRMLQKEHFLDRESPEHRVTKVLCPFIVDVTTHPYSSPSSPPDTPHPPPLPLPLDFRRDVTLI